MKKEFRIVSVAAAVSVFSGCGLNPFGAGSRGLSIFGKIARAIERPSAINDEGQNKQTTKAVVSEGSGMAKRLAKLSAGSAGESWMVANGIINLGNGRYTYWEQVANKPSEEDPDKLVTGRGEVVFGYSGANPTLLTVDGSLITDLYSLLHDRS